MDGAAKQPAADASVAPDTSAESIKSARKKRKQHERDAKLERRREKMAKEGGGGPFHQQVDNSGMHQIMTQYTQRWDEFVAEVLTESGPSCPCVLLVDVQYPGNVGAVLRNCGLCGFGRVLLLSTEEDGNKAAQLHSNAFLKTAVQKSTALKYNWDVKIVVGLPPLDVVAARFHACSYALVALWGVDEERRGHEDEEPAAQAEAPTGALKAPKKLWDVAFDKKVVIVGGSESLGLPATSRDHFDELVYIPTVDPDEGAFNVSHAVHLAAYEAYRSWEKG